MRWVTGDVADTGSPRRAALYDCLFLTSAIAVSFAPYIGGLGLYSDDWWILASFHHSDRSYAGLFASIMMAVQTRPVQGHILAGLYWLFGLGIQWYHVANCVGLTAAVLLFYQSLRTLRVARPIAIAVPLVFGLLPHYSTDRFWIAAFQATGAVLLYFLSLYADLRFVTRPGSLRWLWKFVGSAALVASVMAYEVTAALFLVNILLLLHVAGVRRHRTWQRNAIPTALAVSSNVLFLALAIGYKSTTTGRAGLGGGLRFRALRILTEAAPVHFGDYGLGFPLYVGRVLRDYPDAVAIGVSVLIGLMVGGYLLFAVPRSRPFDAGVRWPLVMLTGAVLFVAGYGVSLMTWEIGFHTTGANNRTAIGAAIGVGWVYVGTIGWLGRVVSSDRWRRLVFSALIAVVAAGSTLITSAVAAFWVDASRQQEVVMAGLLEHHTTLPPGSTILLDGLCSFRGPAPVFTTGWDTSGMLRLMYMDPSLLGDVVKPTTQLTEDGVRTIVFDDVINLYPYGDDLLAFHIPSGGTWTLTSHEVAREYLEGVSIPGRPTCPPYTDGDGVPIF
jgi:hypothetical protein